MPRPAKNQQVVAVLRQAIGLGQQQLARRIDVSKSVIQKIELNERTLTGEVAKRIADHTGVELNWLLDGDYTQPPNALAGGHMTREKYDRHRAWMEGVKAATDAQWARFQAFTQGATIGMEGSEQDIPEDPAEMRRQVEAQAGLEMKLTVKRNGELVPLPEDLRGLEQALAKRLQGGFVVALRRRKLAELRTQFEQLTEAMFVHADGDFLLWQLKERLTEFKAKHRLT